MVASHPTKPLWNLPWKLIHEQSLLRLQEQATFELCRTERTETRVKAKLCIFLCLYKGNCKLFLSAASLFFNSYTIRKGPIENLATITSTYSNWNSCRSMLYGLSVHTRQSKDPQMSAECRLSLGQVCPVRQHWNLWSLPQRLHQTFRHKKPNKEKPLRQMTPLISKNKDEMLQRRQKAVFWMCMTRKLLYCSLLAWYMKQTDWDLKTPS